MENNVFDISDFIPKYPYIPENVYLSAYPNENFNNAIYHKKEFYDEKLDVYESKPSQKGDLMKHQKIISRFLSSHTTYDGLLLYHYMGTGKSCSAIGAMEQIKNENSSISNAIVLARGDNILNNIINEMVYTCTDGRYIPENLNKLPIDTQKSRIKKMLRDFYSFETFYRFASAIKRYSDDYIIKHFSNTIIVIDEVHNLRKKTIKKHEKDVYYQIHRFLHLIKNKKVLLLSGTPMKDRPEEIASVLNLILPLDKQLPFESSFVDKYLIEEDGIFKVKRDKIKELKTYFNGIVSYLKPMKPMVNIKYEGEIIDNLKMFKIFPDRMTNIQNDVYLKTFKNESGKNHNRIEEDDYEITKTGWFSQSRQASLFVFPNKSIGKIGFKEYINERKTQKIGLNRKKSISYTYTLSNTFKKMLKGNTTEKTIENISKYSSKYSKLIKHILDTKGSCFIYCSFVKGSGAILLSLLLELCGFSKANGSETTPRKRYGLLSSTEGSNIKKIIKRFNKPDNLYGDYIRVIIGSRIVGEGLSFFNIQQVHVLTPHWNFSETEQAIARANRSFSHEDLLDRNQNITVNIFLYTSIPTQGKNLLLNDSIDLRMYLKSERKDISIKNIERLIKETAFDCALNYTRNSQYKDDFSRNCEYLNCDYKCDGVPELDITNIDDSTYKLYYIETKVNKITEEIKKLYRKDFIYTFQYISEKIAYGNYEILSALRKIVNNNIMIYNKYGYPNYLREESNSYFLVDNLSVNSKYLNVYYSQIPNLKVDISFQKIVDKQYYTKYIPYILSMLQDMNRNEQINKLDINIQEILLENAFIARDKNIQSTRELQNWIILYYKNFLEEVVIDNNNVIISKLLKNQLRCYKNNTWNNCSKNILEIIHKQTDKNTSRLENNKYGYYGIIKKGQFLIRDVSSEKAKKAKAKSSRTKGQACNTIPRKDLLYLFFKLDIPHDFVTFKNRSNYTKKEQLDIIKDNKKFKNLRAMCTKYKINIKKISNDKLSHIFYIAVEKKDQLCKYIQLFFISNKLIEYQ
jgi:hypothetical protein